MSDRRLRLAGVLFLALIASACHHEDVESCVDASGVWTMNSVHEGGGGVSCDEPPFTWTISQTGCDFIVAATPVTPANGASGKVTGSGLYVEWSGTYDCLRFRWFINATIVGDTMSGTYGMIVTPVYPAPPNCPTGGTCTGTLAGVRQAR